MVIITVIMIIMILIMKVTRLIITTVITPVTMIMIKIMRIKIVIMMLSNSMTKPAGQFTLFVYLCQSFSYFSLIVDEYIMLNIKPFYGYIYSGYCISRAREEAVSEGIGYYTVRTF